MEPAESEEMDAQKLYDEWKMLIDESRKIANRKQQIRALLKEKRFAGKYSPRQRRELDEREIEMTILYKEGKTLQEIGDLYGITRERVRQLLKRHGITGSDGGLSKRPKQYDKPCKIEGCGRLANGSKGYCVMHYTRIRIHGTPTPKFKYAFQEHEDGCLVEGCQEPFRSNGLCNKHNTNFYYLKRDGKVKDLDDYLKVQKAKQMMGKTYARFTEIREFMESNNVESEVQQWQNGSDLSN